jgi:hypothetical protein
LLGAPTQDCINLLYGKPSRIGAGSRNQERQEKNNVCCRSFAHMMVVLHERRAML